ncbi:hypothetical protein AB9F35_15015 [Rhizobium leguminosarum]|uniref:hypothetical protein n=1 Tax=Rhizobium leguminosarum TaxID=384 RepID=UPI003F9C1E75
MKFQTVQVVTADELLKHLIGEVEANHKTSKSGNRRGGASIVAREYGVSQQDLSNTINNSLTPHKRILNKLGLEKRSLYVRKGSKSDE